MPKFEVNITASATIRFTKEVYAETPKQAVEMLEKRFENWAITPESMMPDMELVEAPIKGKDFSEVTTSVYDEKGNEVQV